MSGWRGVAALAAAAVLVLGGGTALVVLGILEAAEDAEPTVHECEGGRPKEAADRRLDAAGRIALEHVGAGGRARGTVDALCLIDFNLSVDVEGLAPARGGATYGVWVGDGSDAVLLGTADAPLGFILQSFDVPAQADLAKQPAVVVVRQRAGPKPGDRGDPGPALLRARLPG